MKKIGLLGGFTWISTLDYYKELNLKVQKEEGGYNSFECIVHSVQFADIMKFLDNGDWDSIEKMLIDEAKKVEKSGAEALVICSNTIAKVAPKIASSVDIPLIDIIQVTGEAIKKEGVKKVGFLGTGYTMNETFYQRRLKEEFGIEAITPSKKDIQFISNAIMNELGLGIIKQNTKIRFLEIMSELIEKHQCEAIVLGCTEIPLLINKEDCDYLLFDTLDIHIKAIMRHMM